MTRKSVRLITLILVFIMLFNFTLFEKSRAAEPITMSMAGFAILLVACGITYLNKDSLRNIYNDFISSVPNPSTVISDLLTISQNAILGIPLVLDTISNAIKNYINSSDNLINEGIIKLKLYQHKYKNDFTTTSGLYKYDGDIPITTLVRIINGSVHYSISTPLSLRYHNQNYSGIHQVSNRKFLSAKIIYVFSGTGSSFIQPYLYVTWKSGSNIVEGTVLLPQFHVNSNELEYPEIENPYITEPLILNSGSIALNPEFIPPEDIYPPLPYVPGITTWPESEDYPGGRVFQGTPEELLNELESKGYAESIVNGLAGSNSATWDTTFPATRPIVGENTITFPNAVELDEDIPVTIPGEIDIPGEIPGEIPIPSDVPSGLAGVLWFIENILNALKNIYNAIKNIFTVPGDLSLNFNGLSIGAITNKFPFSIPWDIKKGLTLFSKSSSTPEFIINIDTQFLKINHTIDISNYIFYIGFFRYVVTIFFGLFLAFKTRDLIKW